MIEINPEKVISDFIELADSYVNKPDLMVALDLDNVSVRLMSASGHLLSSTELHSLLHDFRKCVRRGDHSAATVLYQQIREVLASLNPLSTD